MYQSRNAKSKKTIKPEFSRKDTHASMQQKKLTVTEECFNSEERSEEYVVEKTYRFSLYMESFKPRLQDRSCVIFPLN
jgi:hypothetical protein